MQTFVFTEIHGWRDLLRPEVLELVKKLESDDWLFRWAHKGEDPRVVFIGHHRVGQMAYSAEIDKDSPEKAQAVEVIANWAKGRSTRHS